jgi:hypothetical protein
MENHLQQSLNTLQGTLHYPSSGAIAPVRNIQTCVSKRRTRQLSIIGPRAGTQTAEAEQYQAQGRAASRLLALADLMDRASPVWRRLAQAAVRLPI